MKRRTWLWILLGVVVLHAAGFLVVAQLRPLPKGRYVPPPNFSMAEGVVTDDATGEKVHMRQFTVSTKLEDDLGRPTK